MACFLVPTAEAVVTTMAAHMMKSKEQDDVSVNVNVTKKAPNSADLSEAEIGTIPFSRKLKWLSNLLWGGSALLAFEHIWHGEVTFWYPFLTAADNPVELSEMVQEMSTTGLGMAGLVTLVWLGIVAVTSSIEKKERKLQTVKR